MTSRERKPGTASRTVEPRSAASPLRSGADPATKASLWQSWLHGATPAQQQEMLALAVRQGLIYAQQLPAADAVKSNGKPIARTMPRFLADLLAEISEVTPVILA